MKILITFLTFCSFSALLRPKTAIFSKSCFLSIDSNSESIDYDFDVAVIGAGPGGSVLATLLAEKQNLKVALIDPNVDKQWVPNYGVWLEEWQSLDHLLDIGIGNCLSNIYECTDCFYGGSHGVENNERLRLNRPYARVSRFEMRRVLRERFASAGGKNFPTTVNIETVHHTDYGSKFLLGTNDEIYVKLIVDCSGHESGLVKRQGPHDPGFQIAYGIECEIEGPLEPVYDPKAMLFMDYRTDFAASKKEKESFSKEPTFLYAMPLNETESGKQRIFFEETSLVARPKMSMEACKERLYKRLNHHKIKVAKVEEEEFCCIPMGGSLPRFDQRVVAFGGAGGLVHASTGYMQVRMLAAAKPASDAIGLALSKDTTDYGVFNPDLAAKKVYSAIWSPNVRLQRDFHVFGGEFLMKQNVEALRGFFNAFFKVPLPLWAGFLSGYPTLPHNETHSTWEKRFLFGLLLWIQAPLIIKMNLVASSIIFGAEFGLFKSVTPLSLTEKEILTSVRIEGALK